MSRNSAERRVAIVRQTDHYELPVRREAEALQEAGCAVEVILMQPKDGGVESETVAGVHLTYLPSTLRKTSRLLYVLDYGRFFALVAWTLLRRHRRARYAAVQVNTMPDALVLATLPVKLLGARVVAYMHEPSPELAETVLGAGPIVRVMAFVEQLVLRFADHAIAVTDQLKERYVERGAKADKITVVLNGADPADRIGDWEPSGAEVYSPGTFVVICHGTVEDRYGQDTIVDAAALIREELPDVRFALVGRGKRVEALVEQIEHQGLGDIVQWEGWVTEERLNDLLAAADVGVVAQKASPYSHLVHTNKMVDYWIFGLPVIASRLRAVSELYDDTVLEYYTAGDAQDLVRAIRRLHDDAARRDELVRNGRAAQEAHGWAVQKSVYLGVFERLLESDLT